MKIRTSPLDRLFSHYIRLRDKGICQRCGTAGSLQTSHFHGRAKQSVRYDPDNAVALCFGCHQHLGSHPAEHVAFMLKRLGQERYDMLEHRARQVGKVDKEAIRLYLNQKIKEMDV